MTGCLLTCIVGNQQLVLPRLLSTQLAKKSSKYVIVLRPDDYLYSQSTTILTCI